MEKEKDAIHLVEDKLDALLVGRLVGVDLDESVFPPELIGIAKRLNTLSHAVVEAIGFAYNLARGELNAEPPSRSNYLAGPLKEIHSQLMTARYSMEQLIKGNMVSKLNLPGDFFTWYNLLIEKTSQALGNFQATDHRQSDWGESGNSWRYHQILTAINRMSIMVLEVDVEGKIIFANPNARKTFSGSQLPYKDSHHASALIKYLCTFADRIAETDSEQLSLSEFPILYDLYDKELECWYKITSEVVNLSDGSSGLLHVIDDISDWKRKERELTLNATIDPLSSAYTRLAGMRKLSEMVRLRDEEENCVAFVDIDNLKAINDLYGHTEGDFVIRTISGILLASVRETDWVVRYGGDEFLILLMNSTVDTAQKAIDRMQERIQATNEKGLKPYKLGFSIGLSAITPEMYQSQEVIRIVDLLMYKNKLEKKNLNSQRKL